ncbi:MAG: replication initiation protein [Methanosphaera sp.]|nr:replication initiation protein [Methanosphaera sp.]
MYKNKIKKNALVIKTNKLNEAQYEDISAEGLKLSMVYLSQINPSDISTRIVRFTLAEFTRAMDLKEGKNIKYFNKLAKKLLSQVVSIPNSSGGFKAFPLFQTFNLDKDKETGEWYIEIDAHKKALDLMFNFKNKYFKYELWNIIYLRSNNQIRIYELLKQYENLGERELSISQLRFFLDIKDNQYIGANGFKNLRIKIEACQKALKEKTDICFDFKRGKTGRGGKWLSILFTIYPNMAKKALIESSAKEIKKVLKERVNKTNESLDKPNETTTTTKTKYNDFKKQYITPKKKKGLPSFEYKQWDFDLLRKIIDKTGEDDDFDYDNHYNSQNIYDIDIDKLSDDELMSLDESRINLLSEDNYRKFLSRSKQKIISL